MNSKLLLSSKEISLKADIVIVNGIIVKNRFGEVK